MSPNAGDISSGTEDEGYNIPEITHSVVFKCIGAHKEIEVLALASKNIDIGKKVSVKLKPEPDNPYDNRAIAFICQTEENAEWKRIGYVVREAADEVLAVLNANKILSITFDWIKYIVHFKNRGWYAGIKITRNGEWSQQVLQSRATSYN